jgi:3-dehydroquinate synthase class II
VEKLGRARHVADDNTAHAFCTGRTSFSGNKMVLQSETSSTDTISNTTENPNRSNLQTAYLPIKQQRERERERERERKESPDRNDFDSDL